MMKRIYSAHPLNGSGLTDAAWYRWGKSAWANERANVNRYLRICAWATNEGHVVLTWVHHWLMHRAGMTSGDADFYLTRDERLVDSADELWLCGPVGASAGMQRELERAQARGIPVLHSPQWEDPRWPADDDPRYAASAIPLDTDSKPQ